MTKQPFSLKTLQNTKRHYVFAGILSKLFKQNFKQTGILSKFFKQNFKQTGILSNRFSAEVNPV